MKNNPLGSRVPLTFFKIQIVFSEQILYKQKNNHASTSCLTS